jgi:hypothetical protein
MTSLQGILREIEALPRAEPLPHMFSDLPHEVDALEVERDRLRGVLAEALAIVDKAARETMLDQDPCFALALLSEDEQRRLYALLKGDTQ